MHQMAEILQSVNTFDVEAERRTHIPEVVVVAVVEDMEVWMALEPMTSSTTEKICAKKHTSAVQELKLIGEASNMIEIRL